MYKKYENGQLQGSTINDNLENIFRKSRKFGLRRGWKIDDTNDRQLLLKDETEFSGTIYLLLKQISRYFGFPRKLHRDTNKINLKRIFNLTFAPKSKQICRSAS